MKKYIKLLILILTLSFPVYAWGQCATLYQNGETMMKKGRYSDAINAFKAAMACDSNLEDDCKSQIKKCQQLINQYNSAHSKQTVSPVTYSLTLDKKNIEFECESLTGVIVKVSSFPEKWTVSSNADWCIVIPNDSAITISCETNELASIRTAKVTVSNEKLADSIAVVQTGQKPYITLASETVEFGSKGEIKDIEVTSNSEWEVVTIPEWCEVIAKNEDRLVVKVEKTKQARQGTLVVKTVEGGEISTAIISQSKKKLISF